MRSGRWGEVGIYWIRDMSKSSDQGSMIPEIPQELRARNKMLEHSDQVLAQNCDAVLAGIVIFVGYIIFAKCCQEL